MKQVVKRLELISCAISLEENDLVIAQTEKLKHFPLDEEAKTIAHILDTGLYEEAIPKIKIYIKKFSDLSAYEDSRIQGMRVEIKTFEEEINTLSYKKYKHIKDTFTFNTMYHSILSDTVKEILKLELDMATRTFKDGKMQKEDFAKIKDRYAEFLEIDEHFQDINQKTLSQSDEDELQRLYKKVTHIINPKIVVDELQEEAQEIFTKLNLAFVQNDLERVKNIFSNLGKDAAFTYSYDKIEDRKKLKKQSKILRQNIENLQNEVETIDNESSSLIMGTKESLEHFFQESKKELIAKKAKLQKIS